MPTSEPADQKKKREKDSLKTKRDSAEPPAHVLKTKGRAGRCPYYFMKKRLKRSGNVFSHELGYPPWSLDHDENVFLYVLCNLSFPYRHEIIINPHLTRDQQKPLRLELGDALSPGPVHNGNGSPRRLRKECDRAGVWPKECEEAAPPFPFAVTFLPSLMHPQAPPPKLWHGIRHLAFCFFAHSWWAARNFGSVSPKHGATEQGPGRSRSQVSLKPVCRRLRELGSLVKA